MREVFIYQKIRKIRFFERCRMWKSYSLWKKRMKRTKMNERNEALSKSLFFADETLANALQKIRNLQIKISAFDCFLV